MISFLFFVSSLLLLLLLFFLLFLLFLLFPCPAYSAVGTQAPRPPFSRHIIRLFPIRPVCISLCVSVCVCVCVCIHSVTAGAQIRRPLHFDSKWPPRASPAISTKKNPQSILISLHIQLEKCNRQNTHTHTHTHTYNNGDYYSNFDDIDNGL